MTQIEDETIGGLSSSASEEGGYWHVMSFGQEEWTPQAEKPGLVPERRRSILKQDHGHLAWDPRFRHANTSLLC